MIYDRIIYVVRYMEKIFWLQFHCCDSYWLGVTWEYTFIGYNQVALDILPGKLLFMVDGYIYIHDMTWMAMISNSHALIRKNLAQLHHSWEVLMEEKISCSCLGNGLLRRKYNPNFKKSWRSLVRIKEEQVARDFS